MENRCLSSRFVAGKTRLLLLGRLNLCDNQVQHDGQKGHRYEQEAKRDPTAPRLPKRPPDHRFSSTRERVRHAINPPFRNGLSAISKPIPLLAQQGVPKTHLRDGFEQIGRSRQRNAPSNQGFPRLPRIRGRMLDWGSIHNRASVPAGCLEKRSEASFQYTDHIVMPTTISNRCST